MNEDTKPVAASRKPSKVVVEVTKSDTDHEWVHEGKTMKPGDQAEITLDQAQRLEKVGVIRVVR
jgi:hypothetical protein